MQAAGLGNTMPPQLLDNLMQSVQRSETALARSLAIGPQTSGSIPHGKTTHRVNNTRSKHDLTGTDKDHFLARSRRGSAPTTVSACCCQRGS